MTILRLDLSAGGWSAVPPRLFDDHRLSLDARAVAGYISTRSHTFTLSITGLCSLLRLGEDKWRRINTELTAAGYLQRHSGKDQRGRFRHELLFSPIPVGGFPKNQRRQSDPTTPRLLAQPGADKRCPAPPPTGILGATIEEINKKIEYHHPIYSGGGDVSDLDSKLPQFWLDAANFEIANEEKVRPVKNRGGLFRSIINRYKVHGGPDEATIQSLESSRKVDANREAIAKVAREKAAQELERINLDAQRLSQAEVIAKSIGREKRELILAEAQKKVGTNGSVRGQAAFVERGEILAGLLRHPLMESLLSG